MKRGRVIVFLYAVAVSAIIARMAFRMAMLAACLSLEVKGERTISGETVWNMPQRRQKGHGSLNGCMEREASMKRRILIEMDAEEGADGIAKEIIDLVMDRTDSNVEFAVRQEILSENISKRIEVPEFMGAGLRGKGVRKYG